MVYCVRLTESHTSSKFLREPQNPSKPGPLKQGANSLRQVSKRKRFEVFKRDRFTCIYCGRKPPEVVLHADHIIPKSKGGPDTLFNLVTSCSDCNQGKSNVPLSQIPNQHLESIEERREKLDQLKAILRLSIQEEKLVQDQVDTVSYHWMEMVGLDPEEYRFSGTHEKAVRQFLKLLPIEDIFDSVNIACDRIQGDEYNQFKFFCGVCWQKVKFPEKRLTARLDHSKGCVPMTPDNNTATITQESRGTHDERLTPAREPQVRPSANSNTVVFPLV